MSYKWLLVLLRGSVGNLKNGVFECDRNDWEGSKLTAYNMI